MAKDLKCPVNAHRHIVGDVRTFRLPAQTKKFFIHEPTDSRGTRGAVRAFGGALSYWGASAPFLGLTSNHAHETENRERRRTVFLRGTNFW
jgi:hypothetical protein